MSDEIAYMIQGFFFQRHMQLGIGFKPIEGAVAVFNEVTVRDMFAGVFGTNEPSDAWSGQLADAFGMSTLSDVELTDTTLSFDKRYDGRDDTIHYEFHLDGNLWVGMYSGDYVGEGQANCIVTPIPERMFLSS